MRNEAADSTSNEDLKKQLQEAKLENERLRLATELEQIKAENVRLLQKQMPITNGASKAPFRRLWARCIDLTCGVGFVFAALLLFQFKFHALFAWVLIPIFGTLVTSFGTAILLSTWHTTPGKWLMNIEVKNSTDGPLTYEDAIFREALLLVHGVAFGAPIISLITMLNSYSSLTRTAEVSWDKDKTWKIQCNSPFPERMIAAGVATVIMLILNLILMAAYADL